MTYRPIRVGRQAVGRGMHLQNAIPRLATAMVRDLESNPVQPHGLTQALTGAPGQYMVMW